MKLFEQNYPNTVDSCEDNSEAVYQRDEYINSITVRSKDGGAMKAGEKLQVVVNVDTATSVTGRGREDARETLHIYWASQHIGEMNTCKSAVYLLFLKLTPGLLNKRSKQARRNSG